MHVGWVEEDDVHVRGGICSSTAKIKLAPVRTMTEERVTYYEPPRRTSNFGEICSRTNFCGRGG
jgi:hypothetical protein